jgi:GT2 family glycosyltransferase
MESPEISNSNKVRSPDISVIVVNWNTRELLKACLRSVYDQRHEVVMEVIVVDNASTDRSVEMVRQMYPDVRLIANTNNEGFAKASNQALRICRNQYMLLLNSDAELAPRALHRMGSFLANNPVVGAVGPKILNPDGSFQSAAMTFPTILGEFLLTTKMFRLFRSPHFPSHPEHRSRRSCDADWLSGACLMIRREALEDVGNLDETYFMYSEEVDWCWRAKRKYWKIYYLAEAQALHHGGQSIDQVPLARRTRVYGGKALFFKKHRGPVYAAFFRMMVSIITLMKFTVASVLLLAPKTAIRNRARQNLRSYRVLIADLSGVNT